MAYRELKKICFDRKTKDQCEAVYRRRFESESTIVFDFLIKENPAFLVMNSEVVNLIWNISRLDMLVGGLQKELPHIALSQFTMRTMVDEIKLTNDIEGVNSTRKEIAALLEIVNEAESKKERNRLYGMVYKYNRLMTGDGISLSSCGDIRKLYDDFVSDEVRLEKPDNLPDGTYFRKDPVSVYSRTDVKIHEGLFPEAKIIESMEKALKILNNEEINVLIRIAVFHYFFGYIHPFYDGNGRMTRFISSYLLSKEMSSLVHFRLSYTIKNDITAYYRLFKNANDPRNRGDLTPFVIGFLNFIFSALEDLNESLMEKRETLKSFHQAIGTFPIHDKERDILYILTQNALFGIKGLDIVSLEGNSRFGRSTLLKILKTLEDMHLLKIEKEGKKFLYTADLVALTKTSQDP